MYKGGKTHSSSSFKFIITFEKLYGTHFAEIMLTGYLVEFVFNPEDGGSVCHGDT
jgi:hypothetical protein